MLVVADNTPVRYLILLDYVEILPALFGGVLIPQAVLYELQHPHAPVEVRAWLSHPPTWLDVRQTSSPPAADLAILDPGERDAILLALELHADLLLVDDSAARVAATQRGIRKMGTVGILEEAAIRGLVDLPEALARLQSTNFRIHPDIIEALLIRDTERKRQQE